VTQKGRKGKNKPWFWGIRFVLLIVCWDVYRIPVGFRIILPKSHPDYRTENALFREMVRDFQPPMWAKTVIVLGDAGYSSTENMTMVKQCHKADKQRNWYFVFAIARTWKQENDKSLKHFVTYLPRTFFKRTWIAPLTRQGRRKTFWIFGKQMRLRHVGDVTVVLSKKGRNVGPNKTKILVTNIPEVTARQVIAIYQRRWAIELIFKELKSGVGLGEHQITKDETRVEHSFGIAILAYLLLLRAGHDEIKPGQSWSIFQLQQSFRLRVITNQIEHSMKLKMKKLSKAS
jgi:IS4 transposase